MLRTMFIVAVVSALRLPAVLAQTERATRSYDVSSLTLAAPDTSGPALGFTDVATPGPVVDSNDDESAFTVDELVTLVRANVDPSLWEKENSVSAGVGTLHVTAPVATHTRVAALLDALRARHARLVTLEVRIYTGPPAALDAALVGGSVLDADRAGSLERDPWTLARTARLRAYSGQRVHIGRTDLARYLRDYDAEVAQEALAYDPEYGRVRLGAVDELRPVLSDDGRGLFVECSHTVAVADQPFPTFATGLRSEARDPLAPLDQPHVVVRQLRNALWVPSRGQAIAGAGRFGDEARLLVVRHVDGDAVANLAPSGDAKRALKIFDARHAVHAAPDALAPALVEAEGMAPPAGSAASDDAGVDAGARLTAAALIAMIQQNVDEDSWHNERNRIEALRGRLVVVQAPETLAKVEAYLRTVERARGVSILVRAQVIAATDAEAARELTGLVGGALSDEQRTALAARVAEGRGVEVAADLATVGLPSQRVHAAVIARQPFVADYDPAVAHKVHGLDPVVQMLLSGTILDARPSLIGDQGDVAIALRIDESLVADVQSRSVHDGAMVQSPMLSRSERQALVVLKSGGTALIDLAGQRFARIEVHVSRAGAPGDDK